MEKILLTYMNRGIDAMVAYLLAMENVVGSSPTCRSNKDTYSNSNTILFGTESQMYLA